jgi:hypothetical protein
MALMTAERERVTETEQRPATHLTRGEREEVKDLLWNYEDLLYRYNDRYQDMVRGANLYGVDDPVTAGKVAASNPTFSAVAAIQTDDQLRDLWRGICPVKEFLETAEPRVVRVARVAYMDPKTRTSGAYVQAEAARVSRTVLFEEKRTALEELAVIARRHAINLRTIAPLT